VYARQRRQFIPQGAISFVEIAVVFVDLFDVMPNNDYMDRIPQKLCESLITDMFNTRPDPISSKKTVHMPRL
jgi:hypothetical protein